MKKIKKHFDKIFIASLALVMPFTAFAQYKVTSGDSCLDEFNRVGTLGAFAKYVGCVIQDAIVPLLFIIAMVVFIWGVLKFIQGSENEETREKGKQFMLWGIIGLAVMLSVWGLVSIFTKSVGLDGKSVPVVLPKLPT